MTKDVRITEDNILSQLEFVLKYMGVCKRAQAVYLLNKLPTPIDMSYTEFLDSIAEAINSLTK